MAFMLVLNLLNKGKIVIFCIETIKYGIHWLINAREKCFYFFIPTILQKVHDEMGLLKTNPLVR